MPALKRLSDTPVINERLAEFHGDLAFDVGANAGLTAKVLSPHFGTVVAFEPARESFDVLDGLDSNIRAVNAAVSDEMGTIVLDETDHATGNWGELTTRMPAESIIRETWGTVVGQREVQAVTLDEVVGEYGIPDFIKVDVEGHEVRVIAGGENLFETASPELLIEVHSEDNGAVLRSLLEGYEWARINHEAYSPNNPMFRNHYWLIGHREPVKGRL